MKIAVVGIDLYNQCTTGAVSKTLNSIASDADHVPCVLVIEDVSRPLNGGVGMGQRTNIQT